MPRHGCCVTENSSVVVILNDDTVLQWDLEMNKLIEMPVHNAIEELSESVGVDNANGKWVHLGVILHPETGTNRTLSFVSGYRTDTCPTEWTIWIYQVRNSTLRPDSAIRVPPKHCKSLLPPCVTIRKSNSYGSYQLGLANDGSGGDYLFEYNIFTSALSIFDTVPCYNFCSFLLWNDRLYHSQPDLSVLYAREGPSSSSSSGLLELRSHDLLANRMDSTCHLLPTRGECSQELKAVAECSQTTHDRRQDIHGDDEFLIRTFSDGTLCIWRF